MWFNDGNNKKSTGEGAPLLAPSNASGSGSTKYYFLANHQKGASNRDIDGGEVVEGIPEGSHTDEFAPKQLPPMVSILEVSQDSRCE